MKKLGIIIICLFMLTGCASEKSQTEIRIAEQYGIAYAPVQIMRDQKFLEKNAPDAQVTWEQMANTAAIREAMISDHLDIGFMAIPPFLIGWDNGMDWKIATGLSSVPVGLVGNKEIGSLADIGSDDRIALPQPGSVQHILLAMACQKEFNDPQKMDNQLVTLSHPDGMNVLLAGNEIAAHFTSTPYLELELEDEKMHKILDGKEAFGGDFSFIVGVSTRTFHDDYPLLYEKFNQSLAQAIAFIEESPEEAASILTNYYDLPKEEILAYLSSPGVVYDTGVRGTRQFSDFMTETNYLNKSYGQASDIFWENTKHED